MDAALPAFWGLADASAKLAPSGHDRSRTTVPFRIRHGDEALERMFVERAAQSGILQTFGHHSVGGERAFPKLPKLPETNASKLRASVNDRRTFHDVLGCVLRSAHGVCMDGVRASARLAHLSLQRHLRAVD